MRAFDRSTPGFVKLMLLAATAVTSAAWADDVTIEATPLWERQVPGANPYPMRVEISNSGPDTRGILRARTLNWEMNYPIELPKGAKKTLVAYPCNVSTMGEVTFEIQTEFERVRKTASVETGLEGVATIGMISDAPGLAAFVRSDPTPDSGRPPTVGVLEPEETGAIRDVYVKPQDAPDRPAGYTGMGALVLGEGSDRLTDAQIAAIRTWNLSGGDLVFVGGASAPTLNDPRWRDILPLVPSGVKAVPGDYFSLPATVTTTIGSLSPLSQVDRTPGYVVSASRPHGLGRVVLLTYNPFEKPIEASPRRKDLFLQIFRGRDASRNANLITQAIGSGDNTQVITTTTTMAGPGRTVVVRRIGASTTERDPFNAQLPSTPKVFWILAAYFVLVVPVNLIVLRLLKRGEWAWLTTPLISVAFASIFFTAAGDLYEARLSVATRGLFVGQEGAPTGYVLAKSQIFFPRGGSYDLEFDGVDQVRTVQDTFGRSMNPFDRSELFEEMSPIDVGHIEAPDMRVPNLAFREFTFREAIPMQADRSEVAGRGAAWFVSSGNPSNDGKALVGRIVNRSPYTLRDGMISLGSGRIVALSRNTLAPGESVDFSVPLNPTTERITDPVWVGLSPIDDRVLLVGTLEGFRAGPRLGRLVQERSPMKFVYGLNLKRPRDGS